MTTFATLKKNTNQIAKLSQAIEKMNASTFDKKDDERFWKPTIDKAGNGSAVIRFLPSAKDGEDALPWVRIFSHSFKGPTGKWYIENSLTTPTPQHPSGTKDPCGELNSKLWNMSEDDNSPSRKQARDQKRKLNYYSNIYVISDPGNPSNEGKVFLYRYGKKIFEKILSSMNPEFEGDPQVNPFDLWKGANFKLRVRKVAGYPNYDQSSFGPQEPLSSDESEMERAYNSTYALTDLISPDKFKSYDALKAHLDLVLGTPSASKGASPIKEQAQKIKQSLDDEDDDSDELAAFKALAE